MARVALFAGTDRGHTYPIVAVALALVGRGHDVLVVTGRERGPELDAAGVTWTPIPEAEPHAEHVDLSRNLWSWAAAAARPTAALLRRFGADVVVADVLMAAGALGAELCDLPWLQLVPHHLSDAATELPPMGLGRHPSRLPWVRADDLVLHRQARRSRAAGRADRVAAREALGLRGAGRPVARLIASLPGLEYPRLRWPSDAHLVGPLAWDPPAIGVAPTGGARGVADAAGAPVGGVADAARGVPGAAGPGGGGVGAAAGAGADAVLARLDRDERPLVVASDSTGTGAAGGLAQLTVRALAGLDLQLVAITADPAVARDAAIRWPLGCVVASVPHHRALDLAAAAERAVVVAPGGAGLVGKALLRGLPMALVPDFGDQLEAAARVTWAGAGRRVDVRAPWTPWLPDPVGRAGQLRRAVVRVLADERYAAAAGHLAVQAAALGPSRAAELVELAATGLVPPAEGPTRP